MLLASHSNCQCFWYCYSTWAFEMESATTKVQLHLSTDFHNYMIRHKLKLAGHRLDNYDLIPRRDRDVYRVLGIV
jgi:ribosome-associated toxin RatA of RatAB toxin-antitoxin module